MPFNQGEPQVELIRGGECQLQECGVGHWRQARGNAIRRARDDLPAAVQLIQRGVLNGGFPVFVGTQPGRGPPLGP